MLLCELCTLVAPEQKCALGNSLPKKMKCPDFKPGIERFCAAPAEYTGKNQVYQMALFFGLKGRELKRVQTM